MAWHQWHGQQTLERGAAMGTAWAIQGLLAASPPHAKANEGLLAASPPHGKANQGLLAASPPHVKAKQGLLAASPGTPPISYHVLRRPGRAVLYAHAAP